MITIQRIIDFIYFAFDRYQIDFFRTICGFLKPVWNVIDAMPKSCESSSIKIFNNLYNVSAFKHDLYIDMSSGPTIQIQKADHPDEIIEIENHDHQIVLWYLNTEKKQPIIKTIKNRRDLEKCFGWSDKYFKEFLNQMKPILINWI